MLLYKNDLRAYKGDGLDEVYASNPARFTHQTQETYLRKAIQEGLIVPNVSGEITCLDIGCGQGALLNILYNALKEHDIQEVNPLGFYGLDVSEIAITQANQSYPEHHWIVDSFQEFSTNSAEQFGLKNSFSIILNRGGLTTLGSMEEYESMLSCVNELLCDNGIYFFSQNINYYSIWLNKLLEARSQELPPLPSIFKIANSILEPIKFYKSPGDYIGVYQKRLGKQKSFAQKEPFAVTFDTTENKKRTLFVSGDDKAACFLTRYTKSQQELDEFTFDVPLIYPDTRIQAEEGLVNLAKEINKGTTKPRYLITSLNIHNNEAKSISLTKEFLEQEWKEARFLYFPRRFLTIRDYCRFYPELRQSFPQGIVMGVGLEDHRIDTDGYQPLVDLHEYTNRLDWLFDTLLRDNIHPIWCLSRLEKDIDTTEGKYFYRTHVTQQYHEQEIELCNKYEIPIIDLRNLQNGTLIGNFITNNSIIKKQAISKIYSFLQSNAINIPKESVGDNNVSSTFVDSDPYLLPVSGSLMFDDGTTQPLQYIDAEHLFFSPDVTIYTNQLCETFCKVGYIGGVDFFSRSCQKKHCIDSIKSRKDSLDNVLILGDSTRMRSRDLTGYGQKAVRFLEESANVFHIAENHGSTTFNRWIIEKIVDSNLKLSIAHINAGLHDVMLDRVTKKYHGYNDIDTYAENVRYMIRKLKSIPTMQIVIWATMTPIHPEWHNKLPGGNLRKYIRSTEDIIAYNARAVEVAKEEGAWVNDLHTALIEAGIEKCILRDGVHLTNYGSTIAGNMVAEQIMKALQAINNL